MGKLSSQVKAQIESDLDRAYNEFIKFIYFELSDEITSPAYTGFFASSWKVSTSRPMPVERVEDFSPWNELKKAKSSLKSRELAKSIPPFISPRFSNLPQVRFRETVYIGNTVEYAKYALQRPNQIVPLVTKAKVAAKAFFGTTSAGSLKVMTTGNERGTRDRRIL